MSLIEVSVSIRPVQVSVLFDTEDKKVKDSTIRYLYKRHDDKFAKLFSLVISDSNKDSFREKSPQFESLFSIPYPLDIFQKILTLYGVGKSDGEIDDFLRLDKGTASLLIQRFLSLIWDRGQSQVDKSFVDAVIKKLSWFEFENGFAAKRVPDLTKELLIYCTELNHEQIGKLFNFWHKQLARNIGADSHGAMYLTSEEDLKTMLKILMPFLEKYQHSGYLLIEVLGVKNREDAAIPKSSVEKVVFEDKRRLDQMAFPNDEYVLSVSFRDKDAKKKATCSFGLNAAIFFARLPSMRF